MADEKQEPSRPTGKEALKQVAERVKRAERDVPGANPLTPRARMLDATAAEAADPESHFRYVSARDPIKVQIRKDEGYVAVSEQEAEATGVAVRHGNEDVLMKIPRKEFDKRVARQERMNKDRLTAHKAEFERTVEAVARELRDKHGMSVSEKQLLIDE